MGRCLYLLISLTLLNFHITLCLGNVMELFNHPEELRGVRENKKLTFYDSDDKAIDDLYSNLDDYDHHMAYSIDKLDFQKKLLEALNRIKYINKDIKAPEQCPLNMRDKNVETEQKSSSNQMYQIFNNMNDSTTTEKKFDMPYTNEDYNNKKVLEKDGFGYGEDNYYKTHNDYNALTPKTQTHSETNGGMKKVHEDIINTESKEVKEVIAVKKNDFLNKDVNSIKIDAYPNVVRQQDYITKNHVQRGKYENINKIQMDDEFEKDLKKSFIGPTKHIKIFPNHQNNAKKGNNYEVYKEVSNLKSSGFQSMAKKESNFILESGISQYSRKVEDKTKDGAPQNINEIKDHLFKDTGSKGNDCSGSENLKHLKENFLLESGIKHTDKGPLRNSYVRLDGKKEYNRIDNSNHESMKIDSTDMNKNNDLANMIGLNDKGKLNTVEKLRKDVNLQKKTYLKNNFQSKINENSPFMKTTVLRIGNSMSSLINTEDFTRNDGKEDVCLNIRDLLDNVTVNNYRRQNLGSIIGETLNVNAENDTNNIQSENHYIKKKDIDNLKINHLDTGVYDKIVPKGDGAFEELDDKETVNNNRKLRQALDNFNDMENGANEKLELKVSVGDDVNHFRALNNDIDKFFVKGNFGSKEYLDESKHRRALESIDGIESINEDLSTDNSLNFIDKREVFDARDDRELDNLKGNEFNNKEINENNILVDNAGSNEIRVHRKSSSSKNGNSVDIANDISSYPDSNNVDERNKNDIKMYYNAAHNIDKYQRKYRKQAYDDDDGIKPVDKFGHNLYRNYKTPLFGTNGNDKNNTVEMLKNIVASRVENINDVENNDSIEMLDEKESSFDGLKQPLDNMKGIENNHLYASTENAVNLMDKREIYYNNDNKLSGILKENELVNEARNYNNILVNNDGIRDVQVGHRIVSPKTQEICDDVAFHSPHANNHDKVNKHDVINYYSMHNNDKYRRRRKDDDDNDIKTSDKYGDISLYNDNAVSVDHIYGSNYTHNNITNGSNNTLSVVGNNTANTPKTDLINSADNIMNKGVGSNNNNLNSGIENNRSGQTNGDSLLGNNHVVNSIISQEKKCRGTSKLPLIPFNISMATVSVSPVASGVIISMTRSGKGKGAEIEAIQSSVIEGAANDTCSTETYSTKLANQTADDKCQSYGLNTTHKKSNATDEIKIAKQINEFVRNMLIHTGKTGNMRKELGLCKTYDKEYTPIKSGNTMEDDIMKGMVNCLNKIITGSSKPQLCGEMPSELVQFLDWLLLNGVSAREEFKQYMANGGPQKNLFLFSKNETNSVEEDKKDNKNKESCLIYSAPRRHSIVSNSNKSSIYKNIKNAIIDGIAPYLKYVNGDSKNDNYNSIYPSVVSNRHSPHSNMKVPLLYNQNVKDDVPVYNTKYGMLYPGLYRKYNYERPYGEDNPYWRRYQYFDDLNENTPYDDIFMSRPKIDYSRYYIANPRLMYNQGGTGLIQHEHDAVPYESTLMGGRDSDIEN